MNVKEQLNSLLARLRQPIALIAAASVLGIGLNLAFFTISWVPLAARESSLSEQLLRVDEQRQMLERRPIPAKVQQSDFEKLVRQVPVDSDLARFMLSLHDAEQQAGVTLTTLSVGEVAGGGVDEIAKLTNGEITLGGAANGSVPQPQASPTPQPTASAGASASPNASKAESPFTSTTVSLQVQGTYAQVVDFLGRLYQFERIVNIKQWQLASGVKSQAAGSVTPSPSAKTSTPEAPVVSFSMTLSVYEARQYAGKAPQLPTPNVPAPAKRDDPTMSDDTFLQMLEQLQTNGAQSGGKR